jgi:TonB family protein
MSFSSIAIEQRSKEAQALRLFLGYSLAGSLVLHIALLAAGVGNFLARVPVEEDPIEIAIVDVPEPEVEKIPIQENIQERSPTQPLNNSVNTLRNEVAVVPQPQPQLKSPVIPQKQFNPPAPVQKTEAPAEKPVVATKPVTSSQPETRNQSNTATTSRTTTQISTNTANNSGSPGGGGGSSGFSGSTGILTGSGTGIGIGSGTGSGTGIGNGNGSGIGSGTGTGSGSGTGTASGRGNGIGTGNGNGNPVATAPKPPKIQAPTSQGNGNGRAACRQCDSRYPEQARRRGVEGKVEVAVDTDGKGNVTNVRLTRSSGNRELDEAHLRQAREWKLKPTEGGRQGVSISTDYAIRGSRRYREAQERKRQRQARETEQRKQPTATANQSSTAESPRRRRRLTSGTIVDVPPEVRQRRVPAPASTSENAAPRRQLRQPVNNNVPKPRQSEAATSSGENNAPKQRRRRRRPDSAATPASANKLRNALRRSRQQTESAPAAPASEGSGNQ